MSAVEELCDELGITYRMLDHWARKGYLRPRGAGGPGRPREWPDLELRVARRMTDLITDGLTVAAAAAQARQDPDATGRRYRPAAAALHPAGYRIDWRDLALCAHTDPDLWTSDDETKKRRAVVTCRRCPVRSECLDWATENRVTAGVWGGQDFDRPVPDEDVA